MLMTVVINVKIKEKIEKMVCASGPVKAPDITKVKASVFLSMNELRRQPKWHFPLAQLREKSPSVKDGTSFETEQVQQSRGVRFIAQAGSGLKLPPSTIYVASIFFHRFYFRNTISVPIYETAAASLFLACKTEETPRKTKDVALAVTRVALKSSNIEPESREVARWVDSLCFTEGLMLEALYFDFEVENPYEALNGFIKAAKIRESKKKKYSTKAVSFINDSCRTLLSMIAPSKAIAAAALLWAASELGEPIASDAEWIAESGLDFARLKQLIEEMCQMIEVVRAGKLDGQVYNPLPEQPSQEITGPAEPAAEPGSDPAAPDTSTTSSALS